MCVCVCAYRSGVGTKKQRKTYEQNHYHHNFDNLQRPVWMWEVRHGNRKKNRERERVNYVQHTTNCPLDFHQDMCKILMSEGPWNLRIQYYQVQFLWVCNQNHSQFQHKSLWLKEDSAASIGSLTHRRGHVFKFLGFLGLSVFIVSSSKKFFFKKKKLQRRSDLLTLRRGHATCGLSFQVSVSS